MKKQTGEYLLWLVTLLVLFIGVWQLISNFYQQQVLNQQQTFLQEKGQHLLDLTADESWPQQISLTETYVTSAKERITWLDSKGEILYDTAEKDLTGTRDSRPEVKTVLKGSSVGVAQRKSATLNTQLLYVALPITKDNQLTGILRIAEPTAPFLATAAGVEGSIFSVYLLLCLVVTIMVLYFLRQKNRPLEKILPVLKTMVAQPEKTEIIMQTSSQWQELYQTINQLSEQLSSTYQAYTATEEQLYTLLNEVMIGVFILNEDKQVVMMNPAMKEQLALDSFIQLPTELTDVIQDPALIQFIYRINNQQPHLQKELILKIPEAKVLDLNLRLFNSQRQILGISYDLTRVRELEKIQKDFVGNVSHELKTPVTSLIGFTETLLAGAMEDPTITREFLTIMEQDAKRLQQLIADIIQLTKTESQLPYESQQIDLLQLFEELKASYHPLLQEKNVRLNLQNSQPQYWFSRREFFQPIIKNLVENALHYSPANSQVTVSWQKTSLNELAVTVKDLGIGIAPEDQQRIFERFYRVDKARSRHSGGTGLGLAIVKDYTEKLGGQLRLESHPGVGSTFTVIFPADKSAST